MCGSYYLFVDLVVWSGDSGQFHKNWSFSKPHLSRTYPILPLDGTILIPILPTLSWTLVSSATNYSLQVSTSSSFTSFVFNQSGLTNTSKQVSGLNNFTTYYWRVSGANEYGISDWSIYRSFQISKGLLSSNSNSNL